MGIMSPLPWYLFLQSVKYIMFDHANADRTEIRKAKCLCHHDLRSPSHHYHGSIDHSCPWGTGVWNLLPVAAKRVADQRRACAIQMMCRIRNKGTANVEM